MNNLILTNVRFIDKSARLCVNKIHNICLKFNFNVPIKNYIYPLHSGGWRGVACSTAILALFPLSAGSINQRSSWWRPRRTPLHILKVSTKFRRTQYFESTSIFINGQYDHQRSLKMPVNDNDDHCGHACLFQVEKLVCSFSVFLIY